MSDSRSRARRVGQVLRANVGDAAKADIGAFKPNDTDWQKLTAI
jgi:hypothetical protein